MANSLLLLIRKKKITHLKLKVKDYFYFFNYCALSTKINFFKKKLKKVLQFFKKELKLKCNQKEDI